MGREGGGREKVGVGWESEGDQIIPFLSVLWSECLAQQVRL